MISRTTAMAAFAAAVLAATPAARAQHAEPTVAPQVTEAEVAADQLTFAAHVGSYRIPGNVPADWHRLADFWPGVLYFKRMTKEVDIPGKGRFMRLYLVGDPTLTPVLCRELTKRGKYCQIYDLRAGPGVTLHDGER